MGTMKLVLSDDIEAWIRSKAKYKGDLSRLVELALQTYRKEHTTDGIGKKAE